MLTAVKSIYNNVLYSVKLNGFLTDWFHVKSGLKQGCPLSPVLFNLYINDLALKLNALGKGVKLDDEIVSILLYADDVVLLAENEADLQAMLNALGDWCYTNKLSINTTKSNIVHFRNPSVNKSNFVFKVNDVTVEYASNYKYLGLVLSEHLDNALTAKIVAQSANRALGLLIAKAKAFGGIQYDAFTKLYESMVFPVISCGASIWGTQSFKCIHAVQNRAAKYFLNVGRYTPNAAVTGDIGWTPVTTKCWKSVLRFWCRSVKMENNRLNKKVFCWSNHKSGNRCKNWNFRICKLLSDFDSEEFCDIAADINVKYMLDTILPRITQQFIDQWQIDVNRDESRTGNGGNKLRTYKTFKQTFQVETYCKTVFNRSHRSALAKFRSGTAPIALETGRYNGSFFKRYEVFSLLQYR